MKAMKQEKPSLKRILNLLKNINNDKKLKPLLRKIMTDKQLTTKQLKKSVVILKEVLTVSVNSKVYYKLLASLEELHKEKINEDKKSKGI